MSVTDGTEPRVRAITLTGERINRGRTVNLRWSGAAGADVTANDDQQSYSVNKNGSYTFEICETGSTVACPNSLSL